LDGSSPRLSPAMAGLSLRCSPPGIGDHHGTEII
jgi:hypothetical protein